MSYDISVEAPDGEGGYVETWEGNVTYNLSGMLKAAGLRLDDLDGLTTRQAQPQVASALRQLVDHPRTMKALEPDNGWGSYAGLLEFIALLHVACADRPDGIVRIY